MTNLRGFKQEQASGLCMLNICKPGIFFRGVCFWQSCFVVFVNNEAEVMHTVLQTKKNHISAINWVVSWLVCSCRLFSYLQQYVYKLFPH